MTTLKMPKVDRKILKDRNKIIQDNMSNRGQREIALFDSCLLVETWVRPVKQFENRKRYITLEMGRKIIGNI